jgi:hypothetical protein
MDTLGSEDHESLSYDSKTSFKVLYPQYLGYMLAILRQIIKLYFGNELHICHEIIHKKVNEGDEKADFLKFFFIAFVLEKTFASYSDIFKQRLIEGIFF